MSITINPRALITFATGIAVAVIGVIVFQSWSANAFPGEFDTTYRPITPCRLFDTRPGTDRIGPHASFGVEDEKTIVAHGPNGNCTIPTEAVGLQLNVTAIGATAPSFITVWPGGTRPTASSLNPAPGQPPTPNAVSTNLTPAGTFKAFNKQGNVDVFVDVTGYYLASSLNEIVDRLETLEASRPFAVSARDTETSVGTADGLVVAVSITPPADGQVVVNSTTHAYEPTAGDLVRCSISGDTTMDFDYTQEWRSPGLLGLSSMLAGTRVFDVAANVPTTFNLVCRHVDAGAGGGTTTSMNDSVLTAIFTPMP